MFHLINTDIDVLGELFELCIGNAAKEALPTTEFCSQKLNMALSTR